MCSRPVAGGKDACVSSRPNILFIQTDSHDGRAMGCMGHPAMGRATPNMDALAEAGVMWPTAYTNNPICCPARASIAYSCGINSLCSEVS